MSSQIWRSSSPPVFDQSMMKKNNMKNMDFIKTKDNYLYGPLPSPPSLIEHCSSNVIPSTILLWGEKWDSTPAPAVAVPLAYIVSEHPERNYPEPNILYYSLLLLAFLQETRKENPNYYSSPTPKMYSQRTP